MQVLRLILVVILLGATLPLVSACKRDDGNFEKMEKEMHQTGDDIDSNVRNSTD